MNYKGIIAFITVILVFYAYIPYIIDIYKKKTVPHIFSYFIFGLTNSIIYFLQIKGGAGVGSWVTLFVSLLCIFIFFLCLKIGDKDIAFSDIIFLVLALISLFFWLIAKQPILAIILVVLVDILGFIPTIRKSWNRPHTETLSMYTISTFRHMLSLFALEKLNILTLLNPIAWTLVNGIFAVILIFRRKKILKQE